MRAVMGALLASLSGAASGAASCSADGALQERLAAALRGRGARVAFLRHGNTAKAATDFERELTETGRAQATAAGASFGARVLPIERALCSPAPRCRETLALFLASAGAAPPVDDVRALYAPRRVPQKMRAK